ncbi:DNA fragmentation factor-related protein 4 isoform X2 [Rhynchophorus ferrugineus]|uniref:DNA fragmentation factor-related protein 4 isoform X2 n=1 Tax=Rhynchophorus ferrugineus TaxID=354439 RepID=UPI003FCEBCCC
MTSAKGYKVTDAERKIRVGIAAKNIDELKKKTIEKFKLTYDPFQINFQMPDGTIVDSEPYFETLPAQSLLIWIKEGERAETDAEILYRTIREVNEEYLNAGEKVHEFFTEKMKNKVFKLAEVLKSIDTEKSKLSKKAEHPEWFEGLDTRCNTKEEYMFRRAQDRIRTYYYKTKEELWRADNLSLKRLSVLLNELQSKLKLNKYHGHLFDRHTSVEDPNVKPLCDEMGVFKCDGRWDKAECLYNPKHSINPYASKEGRIIFQTWNLDHQVERSRSIIPAICEALKLIWLCNNEVKVSERQLVVPVYEICLRNQEPIGAERLL